jgi:hypothetical protein
MYHGSNAMSAATVPILPPPNNAGPSPMSPSYSDRNSDHVHNRRDEYPTQQSYYPALPGMYTRPISENPLPTYERHPSISRPRPYDDNKHVTRYNSNPYPVPYSPPSTTSTLGAATYTHSPSRSKFSPSRLPRPLPRQDYTSEVARRRGAATTAHLPPIDQFYVPGGEAHKPLPPHTQIQDGRHVSHTERPNGMDYTGQQFQPPPPQQIQQDSWYFQSNAGYGTGNEGYRGHGQ